MNSIDPHLVVAVFCWLGATLTYVLGYRRAARRYEIISEVPTVATHDIPGLGADMVEVKGVIRCDRPAISDLACVPCVAFACCVTESWTTTRTQTDSKGNTQTITESHSETRYQNATRVVFDVDDATGHVRVEPEGASIDMVDSLRNLRGPVPQSPAYSITSSHFGGRLSYSEAVLPVGQQVYVLGQVGEQNQITRPTGCERPFIISYRTEESLLSGARWGIRIFGALAIFLVGAGVVAIILSQQAIS